MSYSTVVQENDVGVSLVVIVTDINTGEPKDISIANDINILLKRSRGIAKIFPAHFVTDGTDGQVFYNIQEGDLTPAGNWSIQASYLLNGKKRYTSEDVFVVVPNLI